MTSFDCGKYNDDKIPLRGTRVEGTNNDFEKASRLDWAHTPYGSQTRLVGRRFS